MLNKIIENIYSLLGLIFCFFVKRDNKIWVFGARDGRAYCDNTRFFFEWLNEKQKNKIVTYWITKNPNLVDVSNNIFLHNSIVAQKIIAKSSIVFVSHGQADVSRFIGYKKPYVYLWHGIPIKKMHTRRDRLLKFKIKKWLLPKIETVLFLVTSERDAKIFSEAYGIKQDGFYIGQYPRILKLVENSKNNKVFVKKRKILYAPTFRDNNDAVYFDSVLMPSEESLGQLSFFLNEKNAEFYFKLHPYTSTDFDFKSLPHNIHLIDKEVDILDALSCSDILITDYSSVFFDYALLNRPIIYFLPDEDWYLNETNRGLYDDFLTSRAGDCAYNWNDLIGLLEQEMDNPKRTEYLRKKMLCEFFTNAKDTNKQLFTECQFRQKRFYYESNKC